MTKTSNKSTSPRSNRRGGRVTKVDGEAASVAPEGTTEEQNPEVEQSADGEATSTVELDPAMTQDDGTVALEGQTPEATQADQQTAQADELHPTDGDAKSDESQTTDDGDPAAEAPAESPPAEQVDPFADLPTTKIEDYEFRDFTTAETSDPRKYEAVHKAAVEGKLPIKKNWKHAADMITHGRSTREFRTGSVYGTIDQVVRSYGRAGVPAYVLVAKVRQLQIGNKRSHYCTALPPIGWAEGWIDTYISKSHGKVMEKKAPALTQEAVAEVQAIEAATEQKVAAAA